jgi:hypothetical protein
VFGTAHWLPWLRISWYYSAPPRKFRDSSSIRPRQLPSKSFITIVCVSSLHATLHSPNTEEASLQDRVEKSANLFPWILMEKETADPGTASEIYSRPFFPDRLNHGHLGNSENSMVNATFVHSWRSDRGGANLCIVEPYAFFALYSVKYYIPTATLSSPLSAVDLNNNFTRTGWRNSKCRLPGAMASTAHLAGCCSLSHSSSRLLSACGSSRCPPAHCSPTLHNHTAGAWGTELPSFTLLKKHELSRSSSSSCSCSSSSSSSSSSSRRSSNSSSSSSSVGFDVLTAAAMNVTIFWDM